MPYRIESKFKLVSDWFPKEFFTKIYDDKQAAVAIAVEGVIDPSKQEVKVIDTDTNEVVFNTVGVQ